MFTNRVWLNILRYIYGAEYCVALKLLYLRSLNYRENHPITLKMVDTMFSVW
jgi:hypothetical protein